MSFISSPIITGFPTRYASSKADRSNTEEPPPPSNTTEPTSTDSDINSNAELGTDLAAVDRSSLATTDSLHLVNIRVISPDPIRTNPRNLTLRKIRHLSPNQPTNLPPNLPPNSYPSN